MKVKVFNSFSFAGVNNKGRIKMFLIEEEFVSSKPNVSNSDNEQNRPRNIIDKFMVAITLSLRYGLVSLQREGSKVFQILETLGHDLKICSRSSMVFLQRKRKGEEIQFLL